MAITVLPHPNMDFVPLDILTANELDNMVANIEAINNASITASAIANNAVTTNKVLDGAITSAKINWNTLNGSETGWKYLGQVKNTSNASSLIFELPAQYDNYKLEFAGEMASGSSATWAVQFFNGTTPIQTTFQVMDVTAQQANYGFTTTSDSQMTMSGVNQYDTLYAELTSYRTGSGQFRKYQGVQTAGGSAYKQRHYNGRLNNATQPTNFKLFTGGTFASGSVLRVWASNN